MSVYSSAGRSDRAGPAADRAGNRKAGSLIGAAAGLPALPLPQIGQTVRSSRRGIDRRAGAAALVIFRSNT